MKRILLILLILGMGKIAFAQWTTSGNDLYNTNTGSVLIGTTNADVGGSVNGIRLSNNGMMMAATSGTTLYDFPLYLDRRGSSNIGTSIMLALGGYYKAAIGVLGSNSTPDDGGITFSTIVSNATMTEKMRINANGNVGIGTTSPSAKLDINSIGDVIRLYDNTTSNLRLNIGTSGYPNYNVYLQSYQHNTNTAFGNIIMEENGGNVGIGTATPSEKLSVNGKIRAKEIKVEATGWPDFVFEPSYILPDLKETEQFIKANKHLPEIASANEMKKNGLELGEMNIKLLQKIEELTLHLIEMNKLNIKQNERIEQLEKANK